MPDDRQLLWDLFRDARLLSETLSWVADGMDGPEVDKAARKVIQMSQTLAHRLTGSKTAKHHGYLCLMRTPVKKLPKRIPDDLVPASS